MTRPNHVPSHTVLTTELDETPDSPPSLSRRHHSSLTLYYRPSQYLSYDKLYYTFVMS